MRPEAHQRRNFRQRPSRWGGWPGFGLTRCCPLSTLANYRLIALGVWQAPERSALAMLGPEASCRGGLAGHAALHPVRGNGLPDGHDRDVNQLAACAEHEDDRREYRDRRRWGPCSAGMHSMTPSTPQLRGAKGDRVAACPFLRAGYRRTKIGMSRSSGML
jgi:hypothetical protein